eukprot:CAMPEP_0201557786 /NCGR_PEP_ID=MMETSP0173_2-20130828/63960_1 /ASSEMBLY_ACC=CAM_ASM_000268 /TAXON_ID=218659 /ORGANISM="Vexillifera sp., Strain DIVA3 564/2" /LENGTH=184 /DNA_ID=CAMNT_0047970823 /DNA_START=105 /DNA_END=656 /DNA_ORIENTATION=-
MRATLDNNQIRTVFTLGLSTMNISQSAHFVSQPELAFGEFGVPPLLPPNAIVCIDITLHQVNTKPSSSLQLNNTSNDWHAQALALKEQGTLAFRKKAFQQAKDQYIKAEAIVEHAKSTAKVPKEATDLLVILKSNIAQCCILLGHYQAALNTLREACAISPTHVKVRYRMALCYSKLNQLENAK